MCVGVGVGMGHVFRRRRVSKVVRFVLDDGGRKRVIFNLQPK